jgi:hypothetical protein
MDSFFGSIILEVIGAFFKWMYFKIVMPDKKITFNQVLKGKKGMRDVDRMVYGMSNIAIGVLVIGIFGLILVMMRL